MSDTTSIVIVGVGGQGTLLASRVLATAAIKAGCDVKVTEVHGMAQRGGSVVTQVRFGARVYSPLIPQGEADMVLAFELLEGLRWMPFLKKEGKMIVNLLRLNPLPVLIKAAQYPEDAEKFISETIKDAVFVNANEIATQLGEPRAANMVLLGTLAAFLDLPAAAWQQALAENFSPARLQVNQDAFAAGMNLGGGKIG